MADSKTPGWLASNGGGDEEEAGGGGKDWDTAVSPNAALAAAPKKKCCSSCSLSACASSMCQGGCSKSKVCLTLISLLLLGVFTASLILQTDDPDDPLLWILFYSVHVAVPFCFILYYVLACCRMPALVIYATHLLNLGAMVWSIVMIVMVALELKKGIAAGSGSSNVLDAEQEHIMEIVGAGVGFLSALYHSILLHCCITKKQKKQDKEGSNDSLALEE